MFSTQCISAIERMIKNNNFVDKVLTDTPRDWGGKKGFSII